MEEKTTIKFENNIIQYIYGNNEKLIIKCKDTLEKYLNQDRNFFTRLWSWITLNHISKELFELSTLCLWKALQVRKKLLEFQHKIIYEVYNEI